MVFTLLWHKYFKLATALKTYWDRASLRGSCKVSCTDLFIHLFIKRKLTTCFTAVLLHGEITLSTGAVRAEGLGTPGCHQERQHGWAGLRQGALDRGQWCSKVWGFQQKVYFWYNLQHLGCFHPLLPHLFFFFFSQHHSQSLNRNFFYFCTRVQYCISFLIFSWRLVMAKKRCLFVVVALVVALERGRVSLAE